MIAKLYLIRAVLPAQMSNRNQQLRLSLPLVETLTLEIFSKPPEECAT